MILSVNFLRMSLSSDGATSLYDASYRYVRLWCCHLLSVLSEQQVCSIEIGRIRQGPSISNLLGTKWYSDVPWAQSSGGSKGPHPKTIKHVHT